MTRHMCAAVVILLGQAPALLGQGRPAVDRAGLEKNKDVVEQFFASADRGDVEKLRSIVSEDYIEHASYQADGGDALLAAVAENVRTTDAGVRKEKSEIVRMIAEGDEVWVYTRVNAAGTLMARVNMFRLERGRIAEHWAVQEVVNPMRTNANDHFAAGRGPQKAESQPKRVAKAVGRDELERNKDVMRKFFLYAEADDVKDRNKLRDWARPDYIQHNPRGQDGVEGFANGPRPLPHHLLVRTIAEGDYVWCLNIPSFEQGSAANPERANFNQWRIEGGKLAEHWGTYETVQPRRANTNDFFGSGRTRARDLTR